MVRSPVKPAVHSVAEGTMRNEVIDVGLGGGPLRVAPAASTRRPEQVPARRGELDLLRALVVVGLVFFHTAVLFGAGDFPMKAATESPVATVFIAFGATWGMPLLFVVSGMGIWYSLRSRGVGAFARERVRRLLIPLLTGLVALVPLQVYLGSRRAGDTSSYAAFYARFWDVQPSLNFPFVVGAAPGTGVFEVGHLWFLVCLLAFSLVLLPGFAWLRRPRGMRLVERLAGLLARPGAVFLLAMPLVAVELPLGSEVGRAAWNRYSYALLLAYGYLAAADPRIGEAFQRQRRPAQPSVPAGQEPRRVAVGGRHPGPCTQPLRQPVEVGGLERLGRPGRPRDPRAPARRLRQRGGAALLRAPRDGDRGDRLLGSDLADRGGRAVPADRPQLADSDVAAV